MDEGLMGGGSTGLALVVVGCMVGAFTFGLHSRGVAPAVPAADVGTPVTEPLAAAVPPSALPEDQLLASPMLDDPEFLAEVGRWVEFWRTKPSRWFPSYLERMTWFEPHVDSVLAARGLPWSLRYLPVIESGYSPTAVSKAGAVGLWQFMAPTARDFGMEVGRVVDERRDPLRSTEAAADFLAQLHADFDSWFLALAAYNAGPDRVRRIVERHAPGVVLSDSVYWAVREHLPRETREFVPNLFGAMVVAADPEAHGYRTPEPRPFEFDLVLVAGGTRLADVARAAGASRDEITRLNPEYLRGVTPSRTAYVRVPVGSGAVLTDAYRAGRRSVGGGGR